MEDTCRRTTATVDWTTPYHSDTNRTTLDNRNATHPPIGTVGV